MLTKTTISAIRALVHLGLAGAPRPLSPRQIADEIGESPTYLAKTVRHLVRAGILRAHRGMSGGVTLQRAPGDITLRAVIEACQGTIPVSFCQGAPGLTRTCAFHQAMAELYEAIDGALSRWTLGDLLQQPGPAGPGCQQVPCLLMSAGGSPTIAPAQEPSRTVRDSRPARLRRRQNRAARR